MILKSICVYCGSSAGERPVFVEAAKTLGSALAARGIETVYGGGRRGLMGALADSSLASGGYVIGIIPQSLVDAEVAHRGLSELHVVHTMHERKAEMTRRSDGFLILPGAWGTLDELFEALTWAQLGIHRKPVALWNVAGYYDSLLRFIENSVTEGFLKHSDHELLLVGTELDDLLAKVFAFEPHLSQPLRKLQVS